MDLWPEAGILVDPWLGGYVTSARAPVILVGGDGTIYDLPLIHRLSRPFSLEALALMLRDLTPSSPRPFEEPQTDAEGPTTDDEPLTGAAADHEDALAALHRLIAEVEATEDTQTATSPHRDDTPPRRRPLQAGDPVHTIIGLSRLMS